MRVLPLVLASALVGVLAAGAQTDAGDDYKVYTEHPRLIMKPQRLRLLRRERERDSPRWRQLELLVRGNAQMPEAAFAQALAYMVTQEEALGRRAIELALRPATGPREIAFVYDWCQALLTPDQRTRLEARLKQAARIPVKDFDSARTVALSSVVLGDSGALRPLINDWWKGSAAKDLVAGRRSIGHADIYPMVEMFHVIRDNLHVELRDDILPVYRDLALQRLLSYYPAVYPAAENEYRIPYFSGKGEPDLNTAAFSRIAELSLVAYDNNAQEMQFLQGWLMHDRFVLRGALGAPYEFLWANPYQPGLPFEKMPLYLHDDRTGSLLVRSNWDEDATWVGIFNPTSMQLFREGRPQTFTLKQPLMLGEVAITGGTGDVQFKVQPESPQEWFLVGLKPSTLFDIEIDDEDMTEGTSDRGGILPIKFTRTDSQLVRIRERSPRTTKTANQR